MFYDRFTQRLFPAKWANRVSRWLNNVVGDGLVSVTSPDNPTPENPPRVSLDFNAVVRKLVETGIIGKGVAKTTTEMDDNTRQTLQSPPKMKTDTWTADSSAETPDGLKLTLPTRVISQGTSFHILFFRTLEFHPGGQLKSVSAEVGYVRIQA